MRRICFAVMGFVLLILVPPVTAWEVSLRGEFEYRMRYWGRTGPRDLYGDHSIQDTLPINTFIGFAGPNRWWSGARPATASASSPMFPNGSRITRGGFSQWGSDAHVTDMRVTLYPGVRISRAIALYSTVTLGGFRNTYAQAMFDGHADIVAAPPTTFFPPWWTATPLHTRLMPGTPPFERYYTSQTSESAFNTASIVSVEQIKLIVQLPFGIVSLGTKDFPIGTGATYARNTREEAIYLVAPYGPFAFHGYFFPNQQISSRNRILRLEVWNMCPDADWQAERYYGLMVTYDAGPIQLGLAGFAEAGHIPRGLIAVYNADIAWRQGLAFAKYNNGRFFLNAEYAWDNAELRISSPTVAGVTPVIYTELYHSFLELGAFAGPGKLTFLWAQSSGPVLNNANPTKLYGTLPINYQAMEPYNYLMFQTYSGGNHRLEGQFSTMNYDGTGQMGDAYAFGARLDYSIAANLNLWASYLWAHRLERNGNYAGHFGTSDWRFDAGLPPQGTYGRGSPDDITVAMAQAFKATNYGAPAASYNPYVDDGFIGWEVNVGADWKLLEHLTVRTRYAHWNVGPWFTQAYKAFTASGGATAGILGNGILQGRDPLQAVECSVLVDF